MKIYFKGGITYEGDENWSFIDRERFNLREDGPAIISTNGDKFWYKDGNLHREDGPAVEYSNGDMSWYKNGKYHREDGPAVEWGDGSTFWYKNGKYHRLDGPAISYSDGEKRWCIDGELHREDGPAIVGQYYGTLWFIKDVGASNKIIEKISKYKRKSSLVEYLLDENTCIRFFAEKRLKELEELKKTK